MFVRCWIGAKVLRCPRLNERRQLSQVWTRREQLLLTGDARLQNKFFWVLALTAVQVLWVNVEINFHLILHLDGPSAHSDRLDAEGGLLEFSLALVMHRVARHFEPQFFAH